MTQKLSEDKPIAEAANEKTGSVPPKLSARLRKEFKTDSVKAVKRFGRVLREGASVILTLAIIWFGALTYLMHRPSVDLAFFKPHYEQWFSGAFNGRSSNIESYEARWLDDRRAVEITARNIEIVGQDNATQKIELVRGEFALASKMRNRPILNRLSIDGGALTIVRTEGGIIQLGLGTPETFKRVAPLWTSENKINTDSVKAGNSMILLQGLTNITLSNALIFVQDEIAGFSMRADDINGNYTFDGNFVDIDSKGLIHSDGQKSPFSVHIKSTPDRRNFTGKLKVGALNPIHIAPENGPLEILGNLDAPVDLDVELSFAESSGLQDLSVGFKAGEGQLKTGKTFKPFDQASITALYNAESENVDVTELKIKSLALNVEADGQVKNIGTPQTGFLKQPLNYDLDLKNLRLNPGKKFDGPIRVEKGKIAGRIDMPNRTYEFKELDLDFGSFQTDLSGQLIRAENGEFTRISAAGKVNGDVSPSQLLAFWPNQFALGARDWIKNSVKTAVLNNLVVTANIDANDIKTQQIANDHLNVRFEVSDADVQYMRLMPWLRGASGFGTLQGNRMDFELSEGRVDELTVSSGIVEIPKLAPHGGDFTIDLQGNGDASEMMRITNFPPFEFAKQFGMNPADLGGAGNVKLKVTRPLREHFDQNLIRYDLSGDFSDVKLPVGVGKYTLNEGSLALVANKNGISINGPIKIGDWQSSLDWNKKLGLGPIPATYTLSGVVDRDTLDKFGIGLRRHFGGEIALDLSGSGDGLDVQKIKMDADFTQAEVNIGSLWQKQVGDPGTLSGYFAMDEKSGAVLDRLAVEAPGLDVAGSLSIASDFKLQNLDITRAKIDGFVDATVQAKPTEDGVLSTFLTGQYLNVEPWVKQAFQTQSSAVSAPVRLTASIEQLDLSENYRLTNASALFSHDGVSTKQARLKGEAAGGPLSAEIISDFENGFRTVQVEIPDAGRAMLTLLGLDSIKNGRLKIDGKLPPAGRPGGVKGDIELKNFTLVRAPAFAQILSLASLTGLADTLGGSGLTFDTMESQFSFENGELMVREGRASGPALGLTMEGDVGIRGKTLDLNGVLVPSYTMNSVLGDIPLLGDIVVGKKGEGMFALNYSIKGPYAATQVSVNPLSALTPGFLRRIFDVKREEIKDPDIHDLINAQKQEN